MIAFSRAGLISRTECNIVTVERMVYVERARGRRCSMCFTCDTCRTISAPKMARQQPTLLTHLSASLLAPPPFSSYVFDKRCGPIDCS